MAEVHERWRATSLDQVIAKMPETQLGNADHNAIRYVDLRPASGEYDPDETVVMTLPGAKTWSAETYMTSEIMRQILAPNGRMIVFPNNNLGQTNYRYTRDEARRVAGGDLAPLSERQARLVAALGIDSVKLVIGHSFGAAAGATFGRVASNTLQIRANALDEAPNTFIGGRKGLALRLAMIREGKQVIPGIHAVELAAFDEATNTLPGVKEALRYNRALGAYALGGNLTRESVASNKFMVDDSFFDDVSSMLSISPTASIVISNATGFKPDGTPNGAIGSTVSSHDELEAFVNALNNGWDDKRAAHISYDGSHITAGTPFVLAALGAKALAFHDEIEVAGRDIGSLGKASQADKVEDQKL